MDFRILLKIKTKKEIMLLIEQRFAYTKIENIGKLVIEQIVLNDVVIFSTINKQKNGSTELLLHKFVTHLAEKDLLQSKANPQEMRNQINAVGHATDYEIVLFLILLKMNWKKWLPKNWCVASWAAYEASPGNAGGRFFVTGIVCWKYYKGGY